MYIFRKEKMLARLKKEARMAQVDPESAAIMDALDGREVKRNLWRETVHGEAESWFCTDCNGNQYPVNIADCDEAPYLYHDKNGKEIHAGDKLRFPDSSVEVVVETVTGEGKPDLGINASNEAYLKNHPNAEREYYSLCSVNLSILEVSTAKRFKAEYEITLQSKSGSEKSFECEKDGYTSVETLKAETKTVVENMISTENIPDGEMWLKMQISAFENGEESYYDHDASTIQVVDGKIVEFLE